MTCSHWNGALSPCPACECRENVGAGLPDWIGGRICAGEHAEAWMAIWARDLVICEIKDWESDWRTRLEAAAQGVIPAWVRTNGDMATWEGRYEVRPEVHWAVRWGPDSRYHREVADAAAKLRRMRA